RYSSFTYNNNCPTTPTPGLCSSASSSSCSCCSCQRESWDCFGRASFAGRPEPMALLELNGLTKRYGGIVAVDHVTMRIEAGEVRAVIGPNGAGKTSLFHLITGVV